MYTTYIYTIQFIYILNICYACNINVSISHSNVSSVRLISMEGSRAVWICTFKYTLPPEIRRGSVHGAHWRLFVILHFVFLFTDEREKENHAYVIPSCDILNYLRFRVFVTWSWITFWSSVNTIGGAAAPTCEPPTAHELLTMIIYHCSQVMNKSSFVCVRDGGLYLICCVASNVFFLQIMSYISYFFRSLLKNKHSCLGQLLCYWVLCFGSGHKEY